MFAYSHFNKNIDKWNIKDKEDYYNILYKTNMIINDKEMGCG